MIRDVLSSDISSICDIYNHYVEHSSATMEYDIVDEEYFNMKINSSLKSGHFWLVAEHNNQIIGYAYSSQWNPRKGYNHTCEISIYLSPNIISKGWGTRLYTELFDRLKKSGILVIIAVITLPNTSSVALHEKFGMKKVAHFPKMGIKFDTWLDVGFWQLNFN